MSTLPKISLSLLFCFLLSPANAAISTLEGRDVIYQVDLDSSWMSNLIANVTGNTLSFTTKNGDPIISSFMNVKNNTPPYIGFGQYFESMPNDVKAYARNGFGINGATLLQQATLTGEVTGGRLSGLASHAYSALFMYDENNMEFGRNETMTYSGEQNKSNEIQTLIPGTKQIISSDFSSNLPKKSVNIGFYNEITSWIRLPSTDNSFASAQLNQFGVTLQVAPVPEPETYALMGIGLLGLIAARRRKSK